MADRKVSIGFEANDNGFSSTLRNIRNTANETLGELFDNLSDQGLSGNELFDKLKRSIQDLRVEKLSRFNDELRRLREERNTNLLNANSSQDKADIRNRFARQSGQLRSDKDEYLQGLNYINRNFINQFERHSRDVIRNDGRNTDRLSREFDKSLDENGFGNFRDEVRRLREESSSSNGGRGVNPLNAISGVQSIIHGVGQSGTGGFGNIATGVGTLAQTGAGGRAMAGVGKFMSNPYVAAIAAIVAAIGGSFVLSNMRDKEFVRLGQQSGLGFEGYRNKYGEVGRGRVARYGMGLSDFREEFMPSVAQSYASTNNLEDRALRSLRIRTALGVEDSLLRSSERISRLSGENIESIVKKVIKVSDTSQGFLQSNEMLQTFASFQQGQFMRTGSVDNNTAVNLMGRIRGLGGPFNDGQYLSTVLSSLNQGLSQGGTPEANAIKLGILRQNNPNKGLFELQAEMEKGAMLPGYLENIMGLAKSYGGDVNSQMLFFDALTGGSMRKNDIMRLFKGDVDFSDLSKKAGQSNISLEKLAGQNVTEFDKNVDQFTEDIKEGFKDLGEGLLSIGDKIDSIFKLINGVVN